MAGPEQRNGASWHWWGYEESLIFDVASWAVDVQALDTPQAVLSYFDRPYDHSELFEAWCESSGSGGFG